MPDSQSYHENIFSTFLEIFLCTSIENCFSSNCPSVQYLKSFLLTNEDPTTLVSQRFKRYCCKSDTPECRLTENYAYAVPLKYV